MEDKKKLLFLSWSNKYSSEMIYQSQTPDRRAKLEILEIKSMAEWEEKKQTPNYQPNAIFLDSYPHLDDFWKVFDSVDKSALKWLHVGSAGVEKLLDKQKQHHLSLYPSLTLTNSKGAAGSSLAEFVLFSFFWFLKEGQRLETNKQNKKWQKVLRERGERGDDWNCGIWWDWRRSGKEGESFGMQSDVP
eukprot:TRINITY_DN3278_c0_g3_i1.p1 TRINITY_DN3278_c0_g3~~TRINITY_DN3278_c0_g3_i1.p1  ORF type:complete len:189 (+),score=55.87 TRINITY_DN3278_c0_g3_i1:122-688(+)